VIQGQAANWRMTNGAVYWAMAHPADVGLIRKTKPEGSGNDYDNDRENRMLCCNCESDADWFFALR
jgi:hypothetical protein